MKKPEPENVVVAVIAVAGGTLIGRVRLQKVFYLLDQLGLNSGFEYEYHHYGPYSEDLSSAVEDAQAFDVLDEEVKRRASDGMRYSVYTSKSTPRISGSLFGSLGVSKATRYTQMLKDEDATVLELAATIHWLRHREKVANWKAELEKRKGIKTKNGRTERASRILQQLGI